MPPKRRPPTVPIAIKSNIPFKGASLLGWYFFLLRDNNRADNFDRLAIEDRFSCFWEEGIFNKKEYINNAEKIYSATADLTDAPNQTYTVTLELASGTKVLLATNQAFEVTWGDLGLRLGELYMQPYNLTQEVRSLRLIWAGYGVAFQVYPLGLPLPRGQRIAS